MDMARCRHDAFFVIREERGVLHMWCMLCSNTLTAPKSWCVHPKFHILLDYTNVMERWPREFPHPMY